jgi:hypothetical protein
LPWQSFVAVLHALCPLHAFAPKHLIYAAWVDGLGASAAFAAFPVNANATAVASSAPATVVVFIVSISFRVVRAPTLPIP